MSRTIEKFDMTRRSVIVTGGAGLLGREFCRTLAEAGAHVVVADLNTAGAELVAGQLQQERLTALAASVDVTSRESVEALVARTLEAFGRVDVLVNSAALDPKCDQGHQDCDGSSFETFPLAAWETGLDVNLTGAFLCCQAAARPMLAEGRGVVVNIGSIYGLVGPDQRLYQSPDRSQRYKPVYYSVTKAGILGLTRYLATYWGACGIRVNTLIPGGVYNNHDGAFVQSYASRTVLGRMAFSDEMNGALLFLASDASSYMTGANLVVDGGWTAW
jgi:NAD(P)-dependent dehydrogenase (short-subunit alcohol dehydrogenase family)